MAFEIKEGDLAPSLGAICRDDAGAAVDISGGSVVFRWRLEGVGGILHSASANILDGGTTGRVSYDWATGDTDVPGNYIGEFVITVAGRERSFPSVTYIRFSINRRLA